jgi:hypothetical protein
MSEPKMVREVVGPDTAPMDDMRLVFFTGGGTTEENLRGMDREDRDQLRRWFDGSPYYEDFIALIDRINAEQD